MPELVTLDEVKAFLRVDGTDDDTTLAILIAAAAEAVTGLADAWDGTGETPERLKLAVLMLVADWFDNREAVTVGKIATTVPHGVQWLTSPYRSLAP